jgi:tetratricopeptide (TPR) repeat protein
VRSGRTVVLTTRACAGSVTLKFITVGRLWEMALKDSDLFAIDQYFARKQYDRAVELLERLHRKAPKEISLKMKLADAYFLYGRTARAVAILEELAEHYAKRGFITKAMAVQKKIKRFDPKAEIDIYRFTQEGKEEELFVKPIQLMKKPAEAEEGESTFRILDELFSGLSRTEFEQITDMLTEKSVETGQVILKEGERSDSLYIIVIGSVRVETKHKGKNVELALLKSGNFFGEVALLTGQKRTATITADEDTSLLELRKSDFKKLSNKYPQLRHTLETTLERRANDTIEKLLALESGDQGG